MTGQYPLSGFSLRGLILLFYSGRGNGSDPDTAGLGFGYIACS